MGLMRNSFYFQVLILTQLLSCGGGGGSNTKTGTTSPTSGTGSSGTSTTQTTTQNYYSQQWHLKNSLGNNADVDVESVWNGGNRGAGVVVAVVDDAVEIAHEDLTVNVVKSLCYNYSSSATDRYDPTPASSATDGLGSHGTAVTGIIAARDDNNIGVSGIAPRASIAGYQFVENSTVSNAVDAMTRNASLISVSNNSWGSMDATGEFFQPESQVYSAINTGLSTGRGGKGTIYVWAAGNGGAYGDFSGWDGYTNHPGIIVVGAFGNDGVTADYSEPGPNVWITAPSLGQDGSTDYPGIVTTDLTGSVKGYNKSSSSGDLANYNYTNSFNGTSAAAPMVSGVAALLVKAYPNLSWRDVKIVLADSARKFDSTDTNVWKTNDAGKTVNYYRGFGAVDAAAAISLASTWTPVGALVTKNYSASVNQSIAAGASYESSITASSSGISYIEFIEITPNITHGDWGDFKITLSRSGSSFSSVLTYQHNCYYSDDSTIYNTVIDCAVSGNAFTFGVARHLGEAGDGTWKLKVESRGSASSAATFNSWSMKIYGH